MLASTEASGAIFRQENSVVRKDVSLSLMILSFSLGAAPNATAQQYMATDLGTLNGDAVSYGTGINASGQVTGFSDEII